MDFVRSRLFEIVSRRGYVFLKSQGRALKEVVKHRAHEQQDKFCGTYARYSNGDEALGMASSPRSCLYKSCQQHLNIITYLTARGTKTPNSKIR